MTDAPLQIASTILLGDTQVSMPRLGFGVYKLSSEECLQASLAALGAGYRHIDTAQLYRNEDAVLQAVVQSGYSRNDVFLTTKIGRARGDEAAIRDSLLESVRKVGGPDGYVDLFLVHIPGRDPECRRQLWTALEKLHAEGKARAIGVSNFHVCHIEEMKEYARIWPPHVNQIELHPWCQQRELVAYCQEHSIVIQAYSPLATGARLEDVDLAAIASKHGKSPAQILVRYSLQKGWVPLPKSSSAERIHENASVFDFSLDQGDMEALDGLDMGSSGALFPANVS
ncbi:putative aldo-keto reductase [Stachybotrys elegans]|uniref:Aldo-keto reductase n=1 Tax=Stachybotrys elegans TaxID=80388 RepID=A0A8K0T336_9HYPO|nr:putative aldo-keto reductase [Stachybotrys elegans]